MNVDPDVKNKLRDLFDRVLMLPAAHQGAEVDRLMQFIGNREPEAMAQSAAKAEQDKKNLTVANASMQKSLNIVGALAASLAVATVGLGVVCGIQHWKGPEVILLDSSASGEFIPASASDQQMLNDLFRTDAKYFTPMEVFADDGAPVHPEIPSTTPASVIAKGSCAYVFGSRVSATDGRKYAQVVLRINGATSKGYIADARLQAASIDVHEAQPCKATLKP